MSDKTFISELEENQHVQSVFLATSKKIRMTRNDKPYLCLTLQDNTGDIEARIWDNAETLAGRFEADDFLHVRAVASSYKGELQLKVDDLQQVDDADVDLGDFLPHSRWSADEMFGQLVDVIDRHVQSSDVRRIFEAIFSDPDVVRRFKRAPAAKSNHHDYCGGLLEHCLSMTRIGAHLSEHYAHYYPGFLNQDLVIAGCVLHDIGKIDELSYERSFDYTTDGSLIGHITQGAELLTAVTSAMDPPPPADLVRAIKHLILSHHGKKEYGSPVRPRTPEAMLLHQIDMMDSRINMLSGHVEEHRDGIEGERDWTGYHRAMERNFYAGPDEDPDWSQPRTPDPDELPGPGAVPDNQPEPAEPAPEDAEQRATTETLSLFEE